MTRLMVWNIEWMTRLFEADGSLRLDGAEKEAQLSAVAASVVHLDPALIGIVEGPSSPADNPNRTATCLANFATHFQLSQTESLTGFGTRGSQELCLAWDPARIDSAVHAPRGTIDPDDDEFEVNPQFDRRVIDDVTGDRVGDVISFYRPPLEADVVTAAGHNLTIVLCHNKSKGIFGAGDLVNWERESRRNRALLAGQARWIRRRVDDLLGDGRHVVVMGDFNDGVGEDQFELDHVRSSVEMIIGDVFTPQGILLHQPGRPVWNNSNAAWEPSSASFKDLLTEDWVRVLIDFILTSPGLPVTPGSHRIWNPWTDEAGTAPITDALKAASDHHPIVIDLA